MTSPFTMHGKLPLSYPETPADRADDIGSLFRHFGAEPGKYQEIGRDNRALAAQSRWPLLGRLRMGHAVPVQPAAKAAPRPVVPVTPRPAEGLNAAPAGSLSQVFRRLADEGPAHAPVQPTLKLVNLGKI